MTVHPIAQEKAIPDIPYIGAKINVDSVLSDAWINVLKAESLILPIPLKKPCIPFVNPGRM